MPKMGGKSGNPINKKVPKYFFINLDGRYSTHV
jgi:hypothetical protein